MDDHISDPLEYFPNLSSSKGRVQKHLVHQVLELSDCSLFLNQQDVEISSKNDIERESKEELNKEDQNFNVISQEIEDAEVEFDELDPLDDDRSIEAEKDIKLGATQDHIKVEFAALDLMDDDSSIETEKDIKLEDTQDHVKEEFAELDPLDDDRSLETEKDIKLGATQDHIKVEFAELDPMDNDSNIEAENDIKLEATQDHIKVEFDELDPLNDDSSIETEKDIKLRSSQDDIKGEFAELDPLVDDCSIETDDIKIETVDFKVPISGKLRSLNDLNDRINKMFSKKDGDRYGCLHCPFLSSNKSNMRQHVEKHIDGLKELLKCSVCHKSYSTRICLWQHKKKHHSNKDISEDMEENDDNSGGIINIKKLKVGNEFLCNYDGCLYRSRLSRKIRQHLKRHARDLKEDKQKCIIEDCEFKAPSIRSINLRRHLESQHSDVSPVCQQCGKTCSSFKKLLKHMYMHGMATSCDMCGWIGSSLNLNRHIKTNHMNEDSIECNKCNRTYRPFTFHKHKCFRKQEPPKVDCSICGKSVFNLSIHMKHSHNSEIKKVQCPICGKSLKELCIKKHMTSHKEKKACPICGLNVRSMEEHLKTVHTADDKKKFQCQDCGKGFIREDKLQNHRNVHLKTYSYHCRYECGAKYNHQNSRNRHEKKKHGGAFVKSK